MINFLKLGGGLITDKNLPYTANTDTISRVAREISLALKKDASLRLIIGHGSGSFGHMAASESKPELANSMLDRINRHYKVWTAANDLHNIVMNEFRAANLPVISFPPSSSIILENGKLRYWNIEPIQLTLNNGLIPVIYGDVIFDKSLGSTILSTEELFNNLVDHLLPDAILICGIENGVWADYPKRKRLIEVLDPDSYKQFSSHITGSDSIDVTGGMNSKINALLDIVTRHPSIQARIFSGLDYGNIIRGLTGEGIGTSITNGK